VGVIRVDLLQNAEASLRWVAITHKLQRKGLGKRMIELSEQFIREQGWHFIRVPAEESSRGFYEKLGYVYADWPSCPKDAGNIPLLKILR